MTADLRKHVRFEVGTPQEVRDAVIWLAGSDIGAELFEKAYALHGKPLEIHFGGDKPCQYMRRRHAININLHEAARAMQVSPDGTRYRPSLPVLLAHELTHAGQPPLPPEIRAGLEALDDRIQAELFDARPESAKADMGHMLKNVAESPDYSTAFAHALHYVETYEYPLQKAINALRRNDPCDQYSLEHVEEPAVAVENAVAALRGEPLRDGYIKGGSWQSHDEMLRNMAHEVVCRNNPHVAQESEGFNVADADSVALWQKLVDGSRTRRTMPYPDHQAGATIGAAESMARTK